MIINTNVLALNAHRQLSNVNIGQSRASQRLSSGFRINSAIDDAAGLSISTKMRAQIRGIDQASRNAQDAISLIQVAEGAISTINNMLIRVRELVVKASNDTYVHNANSLSLSDRRKIQLEINHIMDEINSIALRTEFNTMRLLDVRSPEVPSNGTTGWALPWVEVPNEHGFATTPFALIRHNYVAHHPLYGHVVAEAVLTALDVLGSGSMLMFNLNVQEGDTIGILEFFAFEVETSLSVTSLINFTITTPNGVFGSSDLNFESIDASMAGTWTITIEFNDLPTNVRVGMVVGRVINQVVAQPASGSFHFQLGANSRQGMLMNISSMDTRALGGIHGDLQNLINVENSNGVAISRQLNYIDYALSYANIRRAKLGATQNRLEFTLSNLYIANENLSAAKSRIKDADIAREMKNLTQSNVLNQAAIAMLAQANQIPEAVLQLI